MVNLFLSCISPELSASHSIEFTANFILSVAQEETMSSLMKSASVIVTIELLLSSFVSRAATVLWG